MAFPTASILALASQCAPTVAPETVLAIVQTESSGDSFALNVNGGPQPTSPSNAVDAAATARRFVAAGYSVDLGLGQINSRNMRRLGLTWETVFDPCTNIAALGQILTQNYNAVKAGRHPQAALRVALSLYNTGNTARGFRNGYVAKVLGNTGIADRAIPNAPAALSTPAASTGDLRTIIASQNAGPLLRDRPAPPPAWNVFERAAYDRETRTLVESERGSI